MIYLKPEGYQKSKFDGVKEELDNRLKVLLDTVENK